jgi:hypothetical protein
VAEIDLSASLLRFAGIGNISAMIANRQGVVERRLVSQNGTVGYEMRNVREFDYPWPSGGLLILFSDGLRSNWDLQAYPGLAGHDPVVISGVLYRDFNRGRDDSTIMVLKEPA